MAREYSFEFPLNIPSWYVPRIVNTVLAKHLWTKVPPTLADKFNFAMTSHTGVVVNQDDLDGIPDDAWAEVLAALKAGF